MVNCIIVVEYTGTKLMRKILMIQERQGKTRMTIYSNPGCFEKEMSVDVLYETDNLTFLVVAEIISRVN